MHDKYDSKLEKHSVDDLSRFLEIYKFKITNIHRRSKTNYSLENYITKSYKLVLIEEGEANVCYNGDNFHIKKGDILLSSPYTLISSIISNDLVFVNIYFEIEPSHLGYNLIKGIEYQCGTYLVHRNTKGLIETLFYAIVTEYKDRFIGYNLTIDNFLQLLIINILREGKQIPVNSKQQQINSHEFHYINLATKYIENNLRNPIKLRDICEELSISENYLYKLFMKHLNVSPSRYIINFKLHHASMMIKANKYSMQEVAIAVGYSTLYHFSASFKKEMGVSPTGFLNRHLEQQQKSVD